MAISTRPEPGSRENQAEPGILAPLPRREFIEVAPADVTPPMMASADFPVSYPRVLRSLLIWLIAGFRHWLGLLRDRLRGRLTPERRAVRLREIFEKRPGTFTKIGQMLAMRIDLLPWHYCLELSQIVDRMAAFSLAEAIEVVERSTGKQLTQTFSQFDPDPILSSSLACTYQAYLTDGTKVAVKVRRPGIGVKFYSDLKALDWILEVLEFLSILRPGFTQSLRRELRETIQDELNFSLEARHQALFRREARKSGKKFFTAPYVFAGLTAPDLIVQEFTSGIWLWEVLAAIEQNDREALARVRELNINPKKVARRLMWVNAWGLDEYMLFRAELRPDNVIVRRNSQLTFLDFSSVGVLGQEQRQAVQQIMINAFRRDPLEMARESLVLLEPLPPLDVQRFTRDLESTYWQYLYALESRHVDWWERTSARLWLGFVRTSREHHLMMSIQVLRLIRSCLLHDTIAARLSPNIDHVKAYQQFASYRGGLARKRIEKRVRQQFRSGLDDRIYLQVEEIAHTAERLFRQMQRALSSPVLKFNPVLDKSVFALAVVFRMLGQWAVMTGLGLAIAWLVAPSGFEISPGLNVVFSHPIYQAGSISLIAINLRMMWFRLRDKEV